MTIHDWPAWLFWGALALVWLIAGSALAWVLLIALGRVG